MKPRHSLFYISTSVWVLGTLNAGQNLPLYCFLHKKLKKEEKARKLRQILAKNGFFTREGGIIDHDFYPYMIALLCNYLFIFTIYLNAI